MKSKPIIPRERAHRDIDEAIDYYLSDGGVRAARGFIDALEKAYTHIGRHPESGSPRYAQELDLPGLRFWPMKRYPYLILYVERDDHVDVWRSLHAERDVPAWLQEPGSFDV